MTLGYPISNIVLGQKIIVQGHRVHKVQKHIEGDRVAGVSLHLYRVPTAHPLVNSIIL